MSTATEHAGRSTSLDLRIVAAAALMLASAVPLFGPPVLAPAGVTTGATWLARLFPAIPTGWLLVRMALLGGAAILLAWGADGLGLREDSADHDAEQDDGGARHVALATTGALIVVWLVLRLPAAWHSTRTGAATDLWDGFESIQRYLSDQSDFSTLLHTGDVLASNPYALVLEGLPLLRAAGIERALPALQTITALWTCVTAALLAWCSACIVGAWTAPVAAAVLLFAPASLLATITPTPLFVGPLLVASMAAALLAHRRAATRAGAEGWLVASFAIAGAAISSPPLLPIGVLTIAVGLKLSVSDDRPDRKVRAGVLAVGVVAAVIAALPLASGLAVARAAIEQRLTLEGRIAAFPDLVYGQQALSAADEVLRTVDRNPADAIIAAWLSPIVAARSALRPWGDAVLDPLGSALAVGGLALCVRWIASSPVAALLVGALGATLAGALAGALAPGAFAYCYAALIPLSLLAAIAANALLGSLLPLLPFPPSLPSRRAAVASAVALLVAVGGSFCFDHIAPQTVPSAATDLAAEAIDPAVRGEAVFVDYDETNAPWLHTRAILSQLGGGALPVWSSGELATAIADGRASHVYAWTPAAEADVAVTATLCAAAPRIRLYSIVDATGRSRLHAASLPADRWEPAIPRNRWTAYDCDPALVAAADRARSAAERERRQREIDAADPRNANDDHVQRLARPDLREAELGGALLAGEDMTAADLRGARLAGARLVGANLAGARLGKADLSGADLSGANLSDADLREAELAETSLRGATLVGAHMSDLDLRRTDLGGANLHRAELDGATLAGKDLTSTNLYEVTLDQATLAGAAMGGLNMHGSSLAGADMTDADMPVIDLSGSNMAKSTLTGARMIGANLTASRLNGADMTSAKLGSADLSGATLNRAALYDAELSGAILRDSVLKKAALRGATLRGADLSGSNLTGAILDGARLDDVAWSNSTCPDGTNSDANGGTCCGHHVGRPPLSCSP